MSDAEPSLDLPPANVSPLKPPTLEFASRRLEGRTAAARVDSSRRRLDEASIRDENATLRDRVADRRDDAAQARDRVAMTLDTEITQGVWNGSATGPDRAASMQSLATARSDAALSDRVDAAMDRALASQDRTAAARDLAMEGIDDVTGALRRRVGLAALQREMDRTARTQQPMVVAFVDVDGLKAINDSQGHTAGDQALRNVVWALNDSIRSYDVVARVGGDEFVCSLAGQDLEGARGRLAFIAAKLVALPTGVTITVGLAEREDGETLDELIDRADALMIGARAPAGRPL